MRFPQGKSLALVIISTVLLVGLVLTLYYVGQRQEDRSRATPSTTLSLSPSTTSTSPLQKSINDPITFDIMINPGTNAVTFVQLDINYDATKLSPMSGTPGFVTDSTTFPVIVEGPALSPGKIGVVVSVGNDLTKAIRTPVRVGTLSFRAVSSTTSPTQVLFGPQTLVTSIGTGDNFSENVLSTSQPGYVSIASPISPTITQPSPTPTTIPSLTPTPTRIPTAVPPTPTRTPTPSPTTIPSLTPTRTPTPQPSVTPTRIPTQIPTVPASPTPPSTRLALSVVLHGIGAGGDNVSPTNTASSNKTPLHPSRQVSVLVYDSENTLVKNIISPVNYGQTGVFVGSADLGTDLPTGKYYVKVKTDQFLRRLISGFITITSGTTTQLPTATLVTGDMNNDNRLDILDYNLLLGCYSKFEPAKSCTADQKLATDLTDDGFVNDADFNLFIRELSVQNGD